MTTTHPTPTLFAISPARVAELPWEQLPAGNQVQTKTLYTCDKVTTGLLKLSPSGRELTHQHKEGEHHLWVLAGELVVDGTRLPAGSYLHVPAHLAHTVEDAGTGTIAFYVYVPTT